MDELGVRVMVGLLVSLIITVLAAVPETRWSANKQLFKLTSKLWWTTVLLRPETKVFKPSCE